MDKIKETLKSIFNSKGTKYTLGSILVIAALYLFQDGCNNKINLENLAVPSTVNIDSLKQVISNLEDKNELFISDYDELRNDFESLSGKYNYEKGRHSYYKELSLSQGSQDPLYLDTCFAQLELDDQTKRKLVEKDKINQALENQIEGLKKQLAEANNEIGRMQVSFAELFQKVNGFSKDSPFHKEKATLNIIDGEPSLIFQRTQTLGEAVESIFKDTYQEGQPNFYRWAWSGGWLFTNNLGDFSTYQGYTSRLLYRPHSRFGIGLQASYDSRDVNRFAPNSSQFGFGVLLEYNFNFKRN